MIPVAKTTTPSVPLAVPRVRLFRRLDAWSALPIVWVSGPPGVGKTTLVASYVAARGLSCVWDRLDAGDADLASFFLHLARAAEVPGRRSRTRAPPLPLLTHEYRGAEAEFARKFFRALGGRVRRAVLVFDDVAEGGPPVWSALRHGLAELPPGTRSILISRELPPPELARLMASGPAARLSGDDLRLERGEALSIARLHAPRGTTAPELARACEQARGWTAGVVLLASRGGTPATSELSRRSLYDYVATEVFEGMTREAREVLMNAALLAPLPVRLATRLCGSERAGAILDELASKAYFTSRRDGRDPTFELHPLLRDFLLARARAERRVEDLRLLRTRAGTLLAEAGYGEHALDLLLDAAAWPEAARAVIALAPGLVGTGRAATLVRWLRAIPDAERERDPWLVYWLAVGVLPSDAHQGRALLERAFAAFEAAGSAAGQYASCIAALEAVVLEWADFHAMDPWLARLDALAARGVEAPAGELGLRLTLAVFAAMTFHRNDSPELPAWEARALRVMYDGAVALPLRVTLGSWFVVESAMRGELCRCRAIVETFAPLARDDRVGPAHALGWLSAESVFHWHCGAAAEAEQAVARGLELARRSGLHQWDYLLAMQGVNAALASDDLASARDYLGVAGRAVDETRPLQLSVLEQERGLVELREGALASAAQRGQVTRALGERGGMPIAAFLGELLVALAATRDGDAESARARLASARDLGDRLATSLAEFVCGLCEAELALRRGDPAAAVHVGRAFKLGREKCLTPDVWFTRDELAALCALSLDAGVEPLYARALVRRLALVPPRGCEALVGWPWPARVRLLGAPEVERAERPVAHRVTSIRGPLALLAVIATSSGGRGVPEHAVEDALWPDSDGAHHALETALYRLRRLIGEDAVTHRDGTLSVDARRCWVDAIALEAELDRGAAALRAGDVRAGARALELAVQLYRGPLLPGRDEPWALAARARLRRRWRRLLSEAGRFAGDEAALRGLVAALAERDPELGARPPGASADA